MSEPTNQNPDPSPAPPPSQAPNGGKGKLALAAAGGAALLVAVAVIAVIALRDKKPGQATTSSGASSEPEALVPKASIKGLPEIGPPQELPSLNEAPAAGFWLEVHDPARLRAALFENPWLQQVIKEPLGQGFLGSWAGLLGTRGEDLEAGFKGTVRDLAAEQLLGSPFRVVWFAGESASGTPAIVVEAPSQKAKAAFAMLDGVATRGQYVASSCPGVSPAGAGNEITIDRWLIAEHAVYASSSRGRLVFARHPAAAYQGLCVNLNPMSRPEGTDLELAVGNVAMGREAEYLSLLLGLGAQTRLRFKVEGAEIRPLGLAGELERPERLDSGKLSDALLRAIPETSLVVLAAHLKLPEKLDAEALAAHFEDEPKGKLLTRQVALVWNPRGDGSEPEFALIWSRPEDEEALQGIFPTLFHKSACGLPAVGSALEVLERLESACGGKVPSMAHAAPAVAQGLKEKSSLSLGVNLGKLMGQLMVDGFTSQAGGYGPNRGVQLPPEIQAAQKRLEELPYFGLRGLVESKSLVPGGFRS